MKKDLLLEKNEKYVLMHNGIICESNLGLENLVISNNISFTLLHLIDNNCKINIELNEGVNANIKEIYYNINKDVNIDMNIVCKKGSNLNLLSVLKNEEEVKIITNVNTTLEENSYINNKNITILSSQSVVNQQINLNGELSKIDSLNVIVNCSNSSQDFNCVTYHNSSNTTSKMINFGICKENSILNINTNGVIKKDSKNSNLSQKTKGLLLDIDSSISANPWLQIDDFDCLASHGASIGAIDEEELYYLMSRGLSREDSEKLIVEGFINPVIKELEEGKFLDYLRSLISKNL